MKISRRPPIISIFQKLLLKDLGGPCPVITQNRLAPLSPSLARTYTYLSLSLSPYAQAKWMQSLIATGYEDYPEGNPDRTQLSKGSLLRLDFSSRASFLFFFFSFFLSFTHISCADARSGIGSTIFTGSKSCLSLSFFRIIGAGDWKNMFFIYIFRLGILGFFLPFLFTILLHIRRS